KDMRTILETIAKEASSTQNPKALTAAIRPELGRLIIQDLVDVNETLPVLTLEPELEQLFNDLVTRSQNPDEIALEPSLADGLFTSTKEAIDELERKEMPAVLVVSPIIRAWLSKLLRRVTKDLTVLSYVEIPDDQPISVTSTISIKREEPVNAE
ncbi:MAG: FHIPEP family type III secretion protein, partial [Pseudomonadota bacterium]|nr:FHIPEP family type III secretion protein [Pseudomonadota bacterium]